jgi:hypothetical protein
MRLNMPPITDDPVYEVLALPDEARANGGVEILRAGLIDHELYVTARHAFKDPAQWGEVLADIARRLGLLYSAEGEYDEVEVIGAIESAFAADLGGPPVKTGAKRPARKIAAKRTAAKTVRKAPPRRSAPKRTVKRTKRANPVKHSKR